MNQLFEDAPALMCLFSGPEHLFTLANAKYHEAVGNRQLIGKPIREALPEVEGQGFIELLDRVYEEGQPIIGKEARIMLARGPEGSLEEAFFNFMYAPFRRLDGSVEGVFVHGVDVTDQLQARRRVEELAEQRQAALRVRDEFLSIASHELRTPVAGIKGSAQLLRRLHGRGGLDEDTLGQFLDRIVQSGDRLASLTQDLLDVSRLQNGRLPLKLEPVNVAELLAEMVERNNAQLDAERIHLEVGVESRNVQADRARIEQVVTNLLQNAIKYSPPSGSVRVRLREQDGGLLCEVADDGIGLPAGAERSIFEPFGRAANAGEGQGMGLGLYICRQIVEQHGGRIWAASEGEQRGTTVAFWLPAGRKVSSFGA